jgi:hypothetical protein
MQTLFHRARHALPVNRSAELQFGMLSLAKDTCRSGDRRSFSVLQSSWFMGREQVWNEQEALREPERGKRTKSSRKTRQRPGVRQPPGAFQTFKAAEGCRTPGRYRADACFFRFKAPALSIAAFTR